MFNNLKQVGVVVIDGMVHYVYGYKDRKEQYIVSSIEGSILKIEPIDGLLRPGNIPSVVQKAVDLLEQRIESKRMGAGLERNEVGTDFRADITPDGGTFGITLENSTLSNLSKTVQGK